MHHSIKKTDILGGTLYYYVYNEGGAVKLLTLEIEELDENKFIIKDGSKFDGFPIKLALKEESYENLFLDKSIAEIWWCFRLTSELENNTCIKFSKFVELYETIQKEYPELILKGL